MEKEISNSETSESVVSRRGTKFGGNIETSVNDSLSACEKTPTAQVQREFVGEPSTEFKMQISANMPLEEFVLKVLMESCHTMSNQIAQTLAFDDVKTLGRLRNYEWEKFERSEWLNKKEIDTIRKFILEVENMPREDFLKKILLDSCVSRYSDIIGSLKWNRLDTIQGIKTLTWDDFNIIDGLTIMDIKIIMEFIRSIFPEEATNRSEEICEAEHPTDGDSSASSGLGLTIEDLVTNLLYGSEHFKTKSVVTAFKEINVHSLEDLKQCPESIIKNLGVLKESELFNLMELLK